MSELDKYVDEMLHNAQARKRIEKFHETGEFIDNEGNKLNLGNIVNYAVPLKG